METDENELWKSYPQKTRASLTQVFKIQDGLTIFRNFCSGKDYSKFQVSRQNTRREHVLEKLLTEGKMTFVYASQKNNKAPGPVPSP